MIWHFVMLYNKPKIKHLKEYFGFFLSMCPFRQTAGTPTRLFPNLFPMPKRNKQKNRLDKTIDIDR
jgi:hypothetical protein